MMRKANNLSQEQCAVCHKEYTNVYLKRRHMGVLHGLGENGQPISAERREYLRCQSARNYVRKRNRRTENRFSDAMTESTSKQAQQSCDDYTAKNAGMKFALVDPATFDCCNVRSAEDIDDFEQCCIPEQKHKNTYLPVYPKKHLRWSRY